MSSLSKVTVKEGQNKIQFSQTDEAITVFLPMKNVLLKQITILYTDLCLKVNVKTTKYVAIIDFLHEVDYKSPKNRVQLLDGRLEVYLIKKSNIKWTHLEVQGLSRQEVIKRRNASLDAYYQHEEESKKTAQEQMYAMDKHAVEQMSKVDAHQRNTIEKMKGSELKRAQDELLGDLDEVNALDRKLASISQGAAQSSTAASATSTPSDFASGPTKYPKMNNDEDIFGAEDIQDMEGNKNYTVYRDDEEIGQCTIEEIEDEEEQAEEEPVISEIDQKAAKAAAELEAKLPEVREQKDVKMEFTEKKFPHMPARESHHKEAPYPKSKKVEKTKDDCYIDIEDKDPLWLKDKGDHWYKRNDYYSALNAYTKSIKSDEDFLMSRLNRATTFLRVRQYQAAADDCTDIERKINGLKKEEREEDEEYYYKMLGRMYVRRGAALAWNSQYDAAIVDLKRAMEYTSLFSEADIAKMKRDIAQIEIRKQSQDIKLSGDLAFARNQLNEALENYTKAMEIDPHNEYALANISVIHLKKQDYEQCLEWTNKALLQIEAFHPDTKEFQQDNTLEVKLLQRRAKCYEIKEEYELAKQDLDRAMMLDRENTAVKLAQQKVQQKLSTIRFEEYREQANQYLKQKQFAEALEFYEKCLKITRKATSLDNIAIYVNKTACLLSLERYNRVITECNDAVRLIKNYKNRNDGKHSPEDQKRIAQMDVRICVRKANALQKLNKVSEAIAEYEKAQKMDPTSTQIQKELSLLRRM